MFIPLVDWLQTRRPGGRPCITDCGYSSRDNIPRIMFGTREYAFGPLRQCLASLVTIQRLFDICVEGLDIVARQPGVSEGLPHSKARKSGDELDFCLSLGNAEFSQNERSQGFPLLHAYTLVSAWGALEAGIEDMLVGILLNEQEVLASDELAKIKIPLGTFELLNKEERMRLLLAEIPRAQRAGLTQGIGAFENVLKVFSLDGPVEDGIKKDLWEFNHVRNVIVHRASRADSRLIQACPSMNLTVGDPIVLTHERYRDYIQAVAGYIQTIVNRLAERYKPGRSA
jgi:hypothetical protein